MAARCWQRCLWMRYSQACPHCLRPVSKDVHFHTGLRWHQRFDSRPPVAEGGLDDQKIQVARPCVPEAYLLPLQGRVPVVSLALWHWDCLHLLQLPAEGTIGDIARMLCLEPRFARAARLLSVAKMLVSASPKSASPAAESPRCHWPPSDV